MAGGVDAIVLSASGYAGAEVLRLLAGHPHLRAVIATGHGAAGATVAELFPHLARAYPDLPVHAMEALGDRMAAGSGPIALFGCGSHGGSAVDTALALRIADELGRPVHCVELSADFRHDAATFRELYGLDHPAPELLPAFHCGLPDLEPTVTPNHACQPGCFTTAVTLACAPLVALGLAAGEIRAAAVTGSTGAGGKPQPGTHHPRRHGNVWGYNPLAHRHAPEMVALIGRAAGHEVTVRFAPHSGPFARGIAATCFLPAISHASSAELRSAVAGFYEHTPFVTVEATPPALDSVVGTNRCHLSVATDGSEIVVQSVIDNLVKGAAGGAVQWMNRAFGWDDDTGLRADPIPWS